ncbi:unnamed protein product [Chrysoparadoxa australica]
MEDEERDRGESGREGERKDRLRAPEEAYIAGTVAPPGMYRAKTSPNSDYYVRSPYYNTEGMSPLFSPSFWTASPTSVRLTPQTLSSDGTVLGPPYAAGAMPWHAMPPPKPGDKAMQMLPMRIPVSMYGRYVRVGEDPLLMPRYAYMGMGPPYGYAPPGSYTADPYSAAAAAAAAAAPLRPHAVAVPSPSRTAESAAAGSTISPRVVELLKLTPVESTRSARSPPKTAADAAADAATAAQYPHLQGSSRRTGSFLPSSLAADEATKYARGYDESGVGGGDTKRLAASAKVCRRLQNATTLFDAPMAPMAPSRQQPSHSQHNYKLPRPALGSSSPCSEARLGMKRGRHMIGGGSGATNSPPSWENSAMSTNEFPKSQSREKELIGPRLGAGAGTEAKKVTATSGHEPQTKQTGHKRARKVAGSANEVEEMVVQLQTSNRNLEDLNSAMSVVLTVCIKDAESAAATEESKRLLLSNRRLRGVLEALKALAEPDGTLRDGVDMAELEHAMVRVPVPVPVSNKWQLNVSHQLPKES